MRVEFQVLVAFGVDLLLGDPRWLPHPVKLMGRFSSSIEAPLRRMIPNARAAGIVAVFAVLTATAVAALPFLPLAKCRTLCLLSFSTYTRSKQPCPRSQHNASHCPNTQGKNESLC